MDGRGRITLGTEYSHDLVEVAIISHKKGGNLFSFDEFEYKGDYYVLDIRKYGNR